MSYAKYKLQLKHEVSQKKIISFLFELSVKSILVQFFFVENQKK